jgi:hypothetical protein
LGDGGRGRGDLILRFRSKYRTVVVETNESDFPVDTLSLSRASPYRRTRGAATTKKNKSSIFVSRKQGKNQQKTGKSSSGSQTKNEPLFFYFKKKIQECHLMPSQSPSQIWNYNYTIFFLNLISLKIIELSLFSEFELISIFFKLWNYWMMAQLLFLELKMIKSFFKFEKKLSNNYAVAIFRIFKL